MFKQSSPLVILVLAASLSHAQASKRVSWDYEAVPITIEVTRAVPVKRCGFERGVLCADAELVISRGDRFQMLAVGQEGGCVIEYRGSRYEPSSCPWLLGFSDPQSDVFVIVEVPRSGG